VGVPVTAFADGGTVETAFRLGRADGRHDHLLAEPEPLEKIVRRCERAAATTSL